MAIPEASEAASFMEADVFAIRQQHARLQGVGKVWRNHFGEKLIAEHGVSQAEDDLDALVDVALHPVGTAEKHLGLTVVAEDEDAAVFEKPSDDTAHADPAAEPANAGAQRARAAHDEFDLHARLRRAIERLNNFFVEERIKLRKDERRAPDRARAVSRSIKARKFLPRFSGATKSGEYCERSE
jgi:hypothetical protein